jgi:hypothetical protein
LSVCHACAIELSRRNLLSGCKHRSYTVSGWVLLCIGKHHHTAPMLHRNVLSHQFDGNHKLPRWKLLPQRYINHCLRTGTILPHDQHRADTMSVGVLLHQHDPQGGLCAGPVLPAEHHADASHVPRWILLSNGHVTHLVWQPDVALGSHLLSRGQQRGDAVSRWLLLSQHHHEHHLSSGVLLPRGDEPHDPVPDGCWPLVPRGYINRWLVSGWVLLHIADVDHSVSRGALLSHWLDIPAELHQHRGLLPRELDTGCPLSFGSLLSQFHHVAVVSDTGHVLRRLRWISAAGHLSAQLLLSVVDVAHHLPVGDAVPGQQHGASGLPAGVLLPDAVAANLVWRGVLLRRRVAVRAGLFGGPVLPTGHRDSAAMSGGVLLPQSRHCAADALPDWVLLSRGIVARHSMLGGSVVHAGQPDGADAVPRGVLLSVDTDECNNLPGRILLSRGQQCPHAVCGWRRYVSRGQCRGTGLSRRLLLPQRHDHAHGRLSVPSGIVLSGQFDGSDRVLTGDAVSGAQCGTGRVSGGQLLSRAHGCESYTMHHARDLLSGGVVGPGAVSGGTHVS